MTKENEVALIFRRNSRDHFDFVALTSQGQPHAEASGIAETNLGYLLLWERPRTKESKAFSFPSFISYRRPANESKNEARHLLFRSRDSLASRIPDTP